MIRSCSAPQLTSPRKRNLVQRLQPRDAAVRVRQGDPRLWCARRCPACAGNDLGRRIAEPLRPGGRCALESDPASGPVFHGQRSRENAHARTRRGSSYRATWSAEAAAARDGRGTGVFPAGAVGRRPCASVPRRSAARRSAATAHGVRPDAAGRRAPGRLHAEREAARRLSRYAAPVQGPAPRRTNHPPTRVWQRGTPSWSGERTAVYVPSPPRPPCAGTARSEGNTQVDAGEFRGEVRPERYPAPPVTAEFG